MQNTWMQYLVIRFIGDIYILKISQNLIRLWFLRMCFSQFFQDIFYVWNTYLSTSMEELIQPSCQAKTDTQKLLFHLNNRMIVPINFNKYGTLIYACPWKNTPVLTLKIIYGGLSMYFGPPCYGYALNCHFVSWPYQGHLGYLWWK